MQTKHCLISAPFPEEGRTCYGLLAGEELTLAIGLEGDQLLVSCNSCGREFHSQALAAEKINLKLVFSLSLIIARENNVEGEASISDIA